ncbi:diguanylate cyclase [Robbsia sp. Bb-Pol-6]|uniref:Diguanylate cyclase n=1 Tax=Robbsia betulipollinis TaxID=2981849 RepID=A0ABT3ZIB5_9BURK|nr:sensor domain-containing diguanylate cyclase [Robbsia betulipollinis]MCY0386102.1 diguanylate cyclase [Robbsia betulipollinis]
MFHKKAPLCSLDQCTINQAYRCFQTAVGALPQGLCLYDEKNRLRLWNEKFSKLYELSGRLYAGMHLDEVIDLTVNAGKYGNRARADIVNDRHAFIEKRMQARFDQSLDTGTIVEIIHVPLEDGGWVATFEDVTILRSTEQQLVHLANHDQLTGLANRRKFTDVANRLIEEPSRSATTLVLIDLDGFKAVNDSMGHAAGDLLLKEVAQRLRLAAADACLIARLGGDEFALLFESSIADNGRFSRACDIVSVVVGKTKIGATEINIDASFGVATVGDVTNVDALVAEADTALYDHKRRKRAQR